MFIYNFVLILFCLFGLYVIFVFVNFEWFLDVGKKNLGIFFFFLGVINR